MKQILKIYIVIILLNIFAACSLFLQSDPDNSPMGIFNSIWTDFDKTYALFDIKSIDWNEIYNKYVTRITNDMSCVDLFMVISDMLGELNDAHVRLASSFAYFNSGDMYGTLNLEPFSLDLIRNEYLNSNHRITGDGMFVYGTFKGRPSIGYIFIRGFAHGENTGGNQDWITEINNIIRELSDTDALILDLRGNTGGLPGNVDYIANRFASEERKYAQIRTKNGPGRNDFSSPVYYSVKPEGTRYTKQIVLITNAQTVSGGEWFTLALRSQDHVTHVGSTTTGALSLGLHRFLVNGWSYWVSVQIVRDMNGICPEGIGIIPDTQNIISNTAENMLNNIDNQLEFALSIIP
jgi:hypothetical protein